jgi:hypothetical protein
VRCLHAKTSVKYRAAAYNCRCDPDRISAEWRCDRLWICVTHDRRVERIGVKQIFGLIGDSLNPLADGCDAVNRMGLRHALSML